MYKVEIDISDWVGDEKIIIETHDFDKVAIIKEFIEFQQEHGWAVDYDAICTEDEDEDAIVSLIADEE